MKRFTLNARNVAILLLFISLLFYGVDFLVFGHAPDIAAGFLGNFAFLPIYVLFVTLVIERVIRERERQVIRQKLNMVIGLFFNEVGTDLLRYLTGFLDDPRDLIERLKVTVYWSGRDFKEAASFLARWEQKVDSRTGDLACLRDYLVGKKGALLGLLENPNLLEHEAFTDLLWAVSHLLQELEARKSLTGLPGHRLGPPVGRHPAGLYLPAAGMAHLHAAPKGRLSIPLFPGGADEPDGPRSAAGGDVKDRPMGWFSAYGHHLPPCQSKNYLLF